MNQLKFQNCRILSRFFSLHIGKVLPRLRTAGYSGILVVPSHKNTRVTRPFSPIEILTKRLSRKLNLPILDGIEKVSTRHQSSLLRKDRFFHAKNAFRLKNTFHSPNGGLLLVDDVFTTGASLNEISRILLESGALFVDILVAARPEEGIEL